MGAHTFGDLSPALQAAWCAGYSGRLATSSQQYDRDAGAEAEAAAWEAVRRANGGELPAAKRSSDARPMCAVCRRHRAEFGDRCVDCDAIEHGDHPTQGPPAPVVAGRPLTVDEVEAELVLHIGGALDDFGPDDVGLAASIAHHAKRGLTARLNALLGAARLLTAADINDELVSAGHQWWTASEEASFAHALNIRAGLVPPKEGP